MQTTLLSKTHEKSKVFLGLVQRVGEVLHLYKYKCLGKSTEVCRNYQPLSRPWQLDNLRLFPYRDELNVPPYLTVYTKSTYLIQMYKTNIMSLQVTLVSDAASPEGIWLTQCQQVFVHCLCVSLFLCFPIIPVRSTPDLCGEWQGWIWFSLAGIQKTGRDIAFSRSPTFSTEKCNLGIIRKDILPHR